MIKEQFNNAAGASTFGADVLPTYSQISIQDVPPSARAPLTFDASKYLPYVAGSDLSEAQAKELLESLWVIVVGFVDLGFGVSPIQQAMDKSQIIEGHANRVVVSSTDDHSDTENRTDGTRSGRASREWGNHEPR